MSNFILPSDAQEGPGPWNSKFELPASPGVWYVTREMAGDWLDNRTHPGKDRQRRMSRTKVATYTAEMKAGRWRLTPEGLMADVEGWIFDGQHRLQALRDSGLPGMEFWIFPDQPNDLFAVVNVGYGRQARQLYDGPNGQHVTSAVRYLGPDLGKYIDTMTPAANLELVSKWPELTTHVSKAVSVYFKVRIPSAPHLSVLAQAERTEYRDKILEWVNGLMYGADLSAGDPRLHLRDRYRNGDAVRRSGELNRNLIAKAWNAYALGERLQVLRWGYNEGTVPIVGFTPAETEE